MAVGKFSKRVRVASLILASAGLALASFSSGALSQTVPVYAESAGDALSRNVRILASSPKDFNALVAAGNAALRLGDAQAAAGFFGRAEEVNPNSPLAKAGMGAALVGSGDPDGALTYFTRAQVLGASAASLGCDRGLAYDLLGRQVAAQTDYRAALSGPDRDEARRRLALSLAIGGNKADALSTLQPLLDRRDVAAQRVRALVLALDGDLIGAKTALDHTMPGASARMDPFFRQLPMLSATQKAAAVHLGIFPEIGTSYGSNEAGGDRLASIEELLRQPGSPEQVSQPQARATYAVAPLQSAPVHVASVPKKQIQRATSPNNDLIQTARVASDPGASKIWLQLASGENAAAFAGEFKRIRLREPQLFTGIAGFVADTGERSRLLIGPFHSREDAQLFADALSNSRIKSFSWTSGPGQVVRKLPTQ